MKCHIMSRYFDSINALTDSEKHPKDYGSGHLLYHSEINLIEAIDLHPGANVMELSKVLGMTRGAVTQMGNRLEKKGMIEKYSLECNKKERYYRLTSNGEIARAGHEAYHKEANRQICYYLASLSSKEANIIMDFLDRISMLPVSEFSCISSCCLAEESKRKVKANA